MEASYPPLKTAREDCANGVAPATVYPLVTNRNPAKDGLCKRDHAKMTNAISAEDKEFSVK